MKILLFCPWAHSNSYYTSKFCNALVDKQISIYLIVPKNFMMQLLHKSIHIIIWPFNAPLKMSLKSLALVPFQIHALRKIIKMSKPDLIHFLWNYHIPVLLQSFLNKYPTAYTVHDPKLHLGERSKIKEWIQKQLIKMSNIYFIHGQSNVDTFIDLYEVDKTKIYKITHGGMFSKKTNHASKQENIILFFGRIREYKGIHILIDAFKKIQNKIPDYSLIICGEGNIKNIKNKISEKDKIVIVNQFLGDEEAEKYFLKSKFIVLPYLEATQSGVAAMAFSFNRTCIASEVGAIPELIQNNYNGLLVQPNNIKNLSEAILKLTNTNLRKKFEKNISNNTIKSDNFTWKKTAITVKNGYNKLLKNS